MSLPLHNLLENRVTIPVDILSGEQSHRMEITVNPAAFTPLLESELNKMRGGGSDVSEPTVEMMSKLVTGWDLTVPRSVREKEIRDQFALAERNDSDVPVLPGPGGNPFSLEDALAALDREVNFEGEVPWPISKENIRKLPFYVIVPILEKVVEAVSPKTTTDEN